MSLDDYRTLGRSGLVISPLALGTMTFGTARWGSNEEVSRQVFNAYVDAGGNFIDTADVYSACDGSPSLTHSSPGPKSALSLGSCFSVERLKSMILATPSPSIFSSLCSGMGKSMPVSSRCSSRTLFERSWQNR